MVEGTPELKKEQALATLQAGRREISAEAKWIRRTLDPKLMVSNLVENHPVAALSSAFGLGLVLAYQLASKRKVEVEIPQGFSRKANNNEQVKQTAKAGITLYLLTTAIKSAAPYLLKRGLRALDHPKALQPIRPVVVATKTDESTLPVPPLPPIA